MCPSPMKQVPLVEELCVGGGGGGEGERAGVGRRGGSEDRIQSSLGCTAKLRRGRDRGGLGLRETGRVEAGEGRGGRVRQGASPGSITR